jgi:hypothetical protein
VDVTFVFDEQAAGKYYPNSSRTSVVHQCKGPCIANEQMTGLTYLGTCHLYTLGAILNNSIFADFT